MEATVPEGGIANWNLSRSLSDLKSIKNLLLNTFTQSLPEIWLIKHIKPFRFLLVIL